MSLVELQGQLDRITYYNEVNHYTVARIRVKGRKQLVTAVGNLFSVSPGELLKLRGTWDVHPKYGEQFKISSYETVAPATEKGIEQYLGSGLIKGIGPVMAKRLVERFGTETLDVIETSVEKLKEVEGFGSKRIEMIKTAWAGQKDIREVMIFLQGHEISSSYAAKIYRHYGRDSIRIVSENPYRLADEIFGIGFQTADRIAEKLGIPKDSEIRAEAGILHVLRQLSDDGHVYYPSEPLIEECGKILSVERENIVRALGRISSEKKIVIQDIHGEKSLENSKAVYLSEFFIAEDEISTKLTALLGSPKNLISLNKDEALEIIRREMNLDLADNQIKAVRDALDKKIMVITGGPGTGKTTIINAIIRIYRKSGQKVALSAPTGRAAKRMLESTGHEAKTIHRLLEYSPKEGGFRKNENDRIDSDLIVIDEASMVDTVLMYHLLKAVPDNATLILVGDVDQLPSVGPGTVLRDIIDSGAVPTVRLNEIFRQSSESLIVVNAHRINRGEFPVIPEDRETPRDFYFIEIEDPEKTAEMILNLCSDKIPRKFGYHPSRQIQVITPMHRGIIGSAHLNVMLQKHLNHSTDELVRGGRVLKTGDKVMQIRNNYDKDVYNGDIGSIASINSEDQEVTIEYDGRIIAYDFTELDEVMLAYAVSVHKSQGSEYPAVVMPLLTQHYLLLQRNLLYTAITRGRHLVVIVGTKKALAIAIRNNKPLKRHTMLRQRLQARNKP